MKIVNNIDDLPRNICLICQSHLLDQGEEINENDLIGGFYCPLHHYTYSYFDSNIRFNQNYFIYLEKLVLVYKSSCPKLIRVKNRLGGKIMDLLMMPLDFSDPLKLEKYLQTLINFL